MITAPSITCQLTIWLPLIIVTTTTSKPWKRKKIATDCISHDPLTPKIKPMFPYTFAVVSDGSKTWNRWLNRVFALMKGPVSFWRCASNPESFCFFRYWWMRFFWNKPVWPKLSVYQYWRLVYLPLFKRISGRWTELFRYQLNHKGVSCHGNWFWFNPTRALITQP